MKRMGYLKGYTTWLSLWLLLAAMTLALSQTAEDAAAEAGQGVAEVMAADESTNAGPTEAVAEVETTSEEPTRYRTHREALVVIGKDGELRADESATAVVVIGGNAKVRGKVHDAAVAIFGDVEVDGEVGDAAVAVMGSIKLGSNAVVNGEAVSVGGSIERAEGAEVRGEIQQISFGTFGLPDLEWLKAWFKQCVLKMRPLSLQVGWLWYVAGAFFLIYLLTAVAFQKPVQTCADTLQEKPFTTFLVGLAAKIGVPILIGILAATGLGLIVVPFLLAAVALGMIIGKVAFLIFLGQSLARAFTGGQKLQMLLAFLIGIVVLTGLYLVPVLGLIAFGVTGVWGFGATVCAMFGGMKRERSAPPTGPASPISTIAPPVIGLAPASAGAPAESNPSAAMNANGPSPSPASVAEAAPAASTPVTAAAITATADAMLHPRAGFWERMGAAFLDVILVSILGALVGGPPQGFLVALAYFAGLWAWKGTTIGGIVLNLKVARLDGGPVTFSVALVRGLAAAFSVIVFFLGFLWIAWDRDKQGWHDKIAGTVVLRLPRGTPLVCL